MVASPQSKRDIAGPALLPSEERALSDARRSVLRASLALASTNVIGAALDLTFQQHWRDRDAIVVELKKRLLRGGSDLEVVTGIAEQVLAAYDSLESPNKGRADRFLLRLAKQWPIDSHIELGLRLLDHRRKGHRLIGYALLQRSLNQASCPLLLQAYREFGDREALEALALGTSDFPIDSETAETVLQALGDNTYLQARVIQRLLAVDMVLSGAKDLAKQYPSAFVWAVGRACAHAYLPIVVEASRSEDFGLVSLAAWSLGKLKAHSALRQLAARLNVRLPALSD